MPEISFDVDKVAGLAHLELTDEERAAFADELPSILAYVGKLDEVDTSNVDPKAYIIDEENVFRSDEVVSVDEKERKRIVDAFPKEKGGALQVPGIFE